MKYLNSEKVVYNTVNTVIPVWYELSRATPIYTNHCSMTRHQIISHTTSKHMTDELSYLYNDLHVFTYLTSRSVWMDDMVKV